MRYVDSMNGGHCNGHMFRVDAIDGLVGYLCGDLIGSLSLGMTRRQLGV